eukprot:COSAG03_NODE_95_length_13149_cov_7.907969_4_plen_73_part_00
MHLRSGFQSDRLLVLVLSVLLPNGTRFPIPGTFTNVGTEPAGSTWSSKHLPPPPPPRSSFFFFFGSWHLALL